MLLFEELHQDYLHESAKDSDIVLHLPVLQYFASLCQHVTEFGVRDAKSTTAFIAGCRGEVHSYDIHKSRTVIKLEKATLPCKWEFHLGDTGDPSMIINDTDMLFLDTLHTYEHVSKELALHGRKTRKFLAFHDTEACGALDRSGPDPNAIGIMPAIMEFLKIWPREYVTVYHTPHNNGLWILQRLEEP